MVSLCGIDVIVYTRKVLRHHLHKSTWFCVTINRMHKQWIPGALFPLLRAWVRGYLAPLHPLTCLPSPRQLLPHASSFPTPAPSPTKNPALLPLGRIIRWRWHCTRTGGYVSGATTKSPPPHERVHICVHVCVRVCVRVCMRAHQQEASYSIEDTFEL